MYTVCSYTKHHMASNLQNNETRAALLGIFTNLPAGRPVPLRVCVCVCVAIRVCVHALLRLLLD